jgi:trimeric autotransporter adhesin
VSGGLAPNASVIYYAAGDTAFQSGLFLAIYRAIDDNNVNILNVSYSACEQELGAAGNQQVLNAWEQAAAQGITVTVSSETMARLVVITRTPLPLPQVDLA